MIIKFTNYFSIFIHPFHRVLGIINKADLQTNRRIVQTFGEQICGTGKVPWKRYPPRPTYAYNVNTTAFWQWVGFISYWRINSKLMVSDTNYLICRLASITIKADRARLCTRALDLRNHAELDSSIVLLNISFHQWKIIWLKTYIKSK